jgi:hypothetical protein
MQAFGGATCDVNGPYGGCCSQYGLVEFFVELTEAIFLTKQSPDIAVPLLDTALPLMDARTDVQAHQPQNRPLLHQPRPLSPSSDPNRLQWSLAQQQQVQ